MKFVTFLLVSWVRCGTWLYWFLIFVPLLTFIFEHDMNYENICWTWYELRKHMLRVLKERFHSSLKHPKTNWWIIKSFFGDIYNQWRPRSDTAELCSVWSLFAHYVLLTLCIRETPKRVHLRTVKTLMKCSIILHFIRVYTVKVKKILRQKNTIFKKYI